MASVLVDVLGPVALIVALGALLGQRFSIDAGSLSRLAYWILGPAFMFEILHDADLAADVVAGLLFAAIAGMTVALLFTVTILRMARTPYAATAAAAMTSAYGNVGNAGLAISVFALGEDALPTAGIFMLAINTTGMMLGVGLAHGRSGSPLAALGQALRAPMTMASLVALVFNVANLQPPTMMARSVTLIAGALIPTMLFTLGIQLRRSSGLSLSLPTLVSMVAKLAIAPLVAASASALIGLEGDLATVAIIQSAMPPAVFCMVVALEHDFEAEAVTSSVVLTTLASILSLPIVLLLVA